MKRVLPYLQLMRLPALFTALTNSFAGLMMTHPRIEPLSEFAALLLATTGLYLAGMVFNDVFDIKQDSLERPERPIPSGRVPWLHAVILGTLLMLGGIAAAATVSRDSVVLALMLAACILAYDSFLKKTWLGPLAMGGCRFLNISLAASAIGRWESIWTRPQLGHALAIGLFITGVTIFARTEALERSRRGVLALGILFANAGLALLFWLTSVWPGFVSFAQIAFALGIVVLVLNRRWFSAIIHPEPRYVQMGVKSSLLSLIVIDATMIYWLWGEPVYALIALAALIPAMLLGRLIPMT